MSSRHPLAYLDSGCLDIGAYTWQAISADIVQARGFPRYRPLWTSHFTPDQPTVVARARVPALPGSASGLLHPVRVQSCYGLSP